MNSLGGKNGLNDKLKVIIFSNDDLTSNIIFSKLFQSERVSIRAIVYTRTLTDKGNFISGIMDVFKKTDFRYFSYLVFINGFFKVFCILSKFTKKKTLYKWPFAMQEECRKSNIPIYRSANINSPEIAQVISKILPDLIIIRINQIIKDNILSIPRFGIWCVHSSLLPSYKGIAGEFHSLRNEEPYIGSTIFKVSMKLDQGVPIAQIAIPVEPRSSLFFHMIKNNLAAGELLKETIENRPTIKSYNFVRTLPSYYSWPKKSDVDQFKKQYKFITFKEAHRYVLKCLMS